MEKLVEEILGFQCPICPCIRGSKRCDDVLERQCRPDAIELITRIGKAYADGELELPGEVGRGDMEICMSYPIGETETEIDGYVRLRITRANFTRVGDTLPLIALRKEEERAMVNDIPRYCRHCGSEEHYISEH